MLLARLPWWGYVLVVWAVSRLYSSTLLQSMFSLASAEGWTFASHRSDPDFFTFSGSWDSSAYKLLAEDGYPVPLPRDDEGYVTANRWAFLPVFPYVVKGVVAVTGFAYYPTAVVIATIFGLAACLVLYRLVVARSTAFAARWSVILFCFGPLGFVLQVAYAETLFLLLLFASLLALVRRHYLLMIPLGVVAAFTRPGVLALALALLVHLVVRFVRRREDPLRHVEAASIIAAGLFIAAAGAAWPYIAGWATGEPDAYLQSELAFWVGLIGRQESFAPFTPWFLMGWTFLGIAGVILAIVVPAAFGVWMWRARSLGNELRAWGVSYGIYLFAVFLPQQSIFRLVMPLAPLLGVR